MRWWLLILIGAVVLGLSGVGAAAEGGAGPLSFKEDLALWTAFVFIVLFLILRPRLFGSHAPLGAELGAPADGTEPFSAARPEWYFLFLFQFL